MILWRISNYADLDGVGGLRASGRWHSKGRPVVYCALNPATALLETLAHLEIDAEDMPVRFQVLRIEGPDTMARERLDVSGLPEGWAGDLPVTQAVGDEWIASGRTPLLEVPCVLVPETWNVVVNARHPEAGLLTISGVYQHPFDTRLL